MPPPPHRIPSRRSRARAPARPVARSRTALACLAAVAAAAPAGCDLLTTGDRAERVRVVVDSSDRAVETHVVTSPRFGFGTEGGRETVVFVTADTVVADLPFDETYELPPTGMFAVRALVPDDLLDDEDPDQNPTLSLRILVDREEVFDESQRMAAGGYVQYYVIDR